MKRLATNVKDLTLKLRQTLQDFPFFGSKEANDDAVLPVGWTSIDTENMRLHIHDGATRGGKTLPNQEDVENVVASASDAAVTSAVEQANAYTDDKVIKDYASYSSLTGTPAGTQFVDNILNGPQGEMYKWNDTLGKYEILRTVTEFSGIGTDVPQAGVDYGPTISVAGVLWYWNDGVGYLPRQLTNKVLSGVASYLYLPAAGPLGDSIGGKTVANRFPCPRRFNGFRLKIPSGDSAVVKYSYAISTDPANNGSGLTWAPITFSGSATITRSGATAILSDLMPRISASSVDQYIFIRAYSATAGYGYVNVGGQYFAVGDSLAFGAYASAWAMTTGDLTGGGALGVSTASWGEWEVLGADFYGPDCFTIGGIGDSLDQGWSVNGGSATESNYRYTAKHAAKYLSSLGYCAGYYPLAVAGEKHVVSVAKTGNFYGNDVFADFVLMRSWSSNDGSTASAFAKSRAETIAAIGRVTALGGIPIVVTPTPCGASGEKETYRLKSIAFALDPTHLGVPVDIASVVADPANPANIAAAYLDTSGNSTHFNSAGYELVGVTYGRKIRDMLGVRGLPL